MIKLAIPDFRGRIAPRLDYAQDLLLLTIENGEVVEKRPMRFVSYSFAERMQLMKDQGVDVLICGGIDHQSMRLLRASGIELYSWVTGEVDDAIKMFLKGDLKPGTMLDSRGRRRARGHGAGGRRNRSAHPHSI